MPKERMHGLAVFDADGTLIDRRDPDIGKHHIPDETQAGLEALRQAHHSTTVCTSNGISEMMFKLELLHKNRIKPKKRLLSRHVPLGISSGANIIDQEGRSLHAQVIPVEIRDAIAHHIPFLATEYVAITTIPQNDPKGKIEVTDFFCHTPDAYFDCQERFRHRSRFYFDEGGLNSYATQFLFFQDPIVVTVKLRKPWAGIQIPTEIPHHLHHSGFIDFFAPGTSKLNAAELIADHLGVPLKVVGGDDRNDKPFFRNNRLIRFGVGPRIKGMLEEDHIDTSEVAFMEDPAALGLALQALVASGRLYDENKGWFYYNN